MPELHSENSLILGAVIVAGGRGARFGAESPKQFQLLAGRPVIVHAIEALAALPGASEIVLVLPEGALPDELTAILQAGRIAGVPGCRIASVPGGARRQDSAAAGLAALGAACDVILVHDAARPFPPRAAMIDAVRRAREIGGAILAMPVTDTVKKSDAAGRIAATLPRGELWLAQTPQIFQGARKAEMIALFRGEKEFTDEAGAMEALGIPVALVEGSPANLKITYPEDLARLEALARAGLAGA